MFEEAPDAIYILDGERRFVDCNEAAAQLLETDRDEIRGKKFGDHSRGEMRLRATELWDELERNGKVSFEHVVTDTTGISHRVAVRARAHFAPGRHLFIARRIDIPLAADPVLTAREREVLSLLAAGMNAPSAAAELFLSPHTVRTHVQNARLKLGASTTVQAIAIALRNREIDP